MLVFRHPKYYEEMRKRAKKFQKEQADKQASEQANEELKSLQAYVKKTKKPI